MRDVVHKIRLDLDKSKKRISFSISKGNTISRTLYITFLNCGTVYDIPEDAIATLMAVKPDGRKVYNDCVIQGNEISYTITNQLIALEGDVECQIKVTANNGFELYSPVFIMRVYDRMFDESILESTNDYSALQLYCIRAENAAKDAESTATEIKNLLKNIGTVGTDE